MQVLSVNFAFIPSTWFIHPNLNIACVLLTITGLNDCCSYRGQFENDLPHGIGIIELRNGRIWEGECAEGVAQGGT